MLYQRFVMIEIIYNGEKEIICEGETLAEFLMHRDFAGPFAAAVNEIFIPRAEHEKKIIQQGDRIEVLTAMPGG